MIEFETYKFEPGAMSIIQMGEELIGHPSTAINELVKNSYDADADKCLVYTQYDKEPTRTFFIIKDNGLGMSNATLFGDWLKPSVSSKRNEDREKRRSPVYERKYLGSKGIGRLAAMALGRHLTVITKTKGETDYNWLILDREDFKSEVSLDQIKFPGGKIKKYIDLFSDENLILRKSFKRNGNLINILLDEENFGSFDEGTLIVLEHLDDSVKTIIEEEFNFKDIQDTSIFKSLRDLITPLKLNSDIQEELVKEKIIAQKVPIANGESTFDLFYGINFVKEQIKGKIEFIPIEPSPILKEYDYRVFGKVANTKSEVENQILVDGRYICKRIQSDLRDEEFKLEEEFVLSDENLSKRRIKDLEVPSKYRDADVGEFYFDIRVYDLDLDSKDKMVQILHASGKREATQAFSKYLGLKISKNGFGVKPYGEEEQDWLGLGAKRVQKHEVTIGPNQIIGYAFLYSPQNDALSEKTNREGFFENKAFITFKKVLDGILEEAGRRRNKYRIQHNLASKTKNKFGRPDTEKFVQYILNSSDNQELISKTKRFVDETNTALDNLEYSLSFSQRLATLGTGLELVYHEMSQPISALGASTKSIEVNVKKIPDKDLKERILDRLSNVDSSIEMLETLKDSLQPAIGKSLPKSFKPIETFKKVCFLFEQYFKEQEVILEIKKNIESVEIKSYEYVFWISFLNIINNAAYWLKLAEGRKVIIFEYQSPDTFVLSNTGPEIQEEELELIFEYGVTSKKEKNATGLGLAFTRSMLEMRGWKIWAENREYGPAFFISRSSTNE